MANTYLCSNGERVNQRQINSRLSKAKKGFIERYVCESCGKNQGTDWSHTISQKRCKELHATELIWTEANGSWDCRECHQNWENFKNPNYLDARYWHKRMVFVAAHDEEGFRKRLLYVEDPVKMKKLLGLIG